MLIGILRLLSHHQTSPNSKNITRSCSSIIIDNTTYNIHRLVAINFIDNLDLNKNIVNHINGDKNDNREVNLEWVTPSQNTKKYIDSDRNKTKSGSDLNYSKINEKDAINIYIWKVDILILQKYTTLVDNLFVVLKIEEIGKMQQKVLF